MNTPVDIAIKWNFFPTIKNEDLGNCLTFANVTIAIAPMGYSIHQLHVITEF